MAENERKEFDPKAAAEARKAELEAMMTRLEQGVKDVFNGDNFKEYLNFCSRLPRYSINNQILIMMQRPDATMCQSFSGWKEMNRFVKKGEKGIRIMAPSPFKKEVEQDRLDANGNPVIGANGEPVKETVEITVNAFKPVSTFDISQTEGDPIPNLGVNELIGSVNGYEQLLDVLKEVIPVPIAFEEIASGAKGYFNVEENRIAVQKDMSEAQTIKTIIHEAAHQALHSREAGNEEAQNKSRNQKETEAESVAYVVCQHYGIDTSDYSFGYVAGWSADKDVTELKASLDTIRRAAAGLIVKIDEKLRDIDIFKDVNQWIEEHGEEIPFADPEPVRKPSVLEQLKEEKAKSELTKSERKVPDKSLEAVI